MAKKDEKLSLEDGYAICVKYDICWWRNVYHLSRVTDLLQISRSL